MSKEASARKHEGPCSLQCAESKRKFTNSFSKHNVHYIKGVVDIYYCHYAEKATCKTFMTIPLVT